MTEFSGGMKYNLLNGIMTKMSLSLPHNYSLYLATDFMDRFKDTPIKLDNLLLEANLGYDVANNASPNTFVAKMLFAGLIGVKAEVSVDASQSLEVAFNKLVKITDEISGGCHFTGDAAARNCTGGDAESPGLCPALGGGPRRG